MTPRALTGYRAFHSLHAPHGPLVFGADEPTATRYRAWAACPCGAAWEWWVSVAEAIADLDVGDAWRVPRQCSWPAAGRQIRDLSKS
jgi:hypothetical protein